LAKSGVRVVSKAAIEMHGEESRLLSRHRIGERGQCSNVTGKAESAIRSFSQVVDIERIDAVPREREPRFVLGWQRIWVDGQAILEHLFGSSSRLKDRGLIYVSERRAVVLIVRKGDGPQSFNQSVCRWQRFACATLRSQGKSRAEEEDRPSRADLVAEVASEAFVDVATLAIEAAAPPQTSCGRYCESSASRRVRPETNEMEAVGIERTCGDASGTASALEQLTGATVSKMLNIPNIPNSAFPETKKWEDQGSHRTLYRFSETDFTNLASVWKGVHPEDGEELSVQQGPPEGGAQADFPESPEHFARGTTRVSWRRSRRR